MQQTGYKNEDVKRNFACYQFRISYDWSTLTDDSDENAASQPEQKSKLKFTDWTKWKKLFNKHLHKLWSAVKWGTQKTQINLRKACHSERDPSQQGDVKWRLL